MTVPLSVRIAVAPILLLPRLLGWRPYDGFYQGNKFRKYYASCLPVSRRDFETLPVKFGAMAVDLTDLNPYPLTKGDVADAVQASSAIPVLRKPVPVGARALLVDGAMLVNLPVDEARVLGADLVIAVPVSERLEQMPKESFRRIGSVARRMEQLFLSASDAVELGHADFVIHPNTDGISVLSTKSKDAVRAIQSGETAANAALPALAKKFADFGIVLPARLDQSPNEEQRQ